MENKSERGKIDPGNIYATQGNSEEISEAESVKYLSIRPNRGKIWKTRLELKKRIRS